MGARVKIRLEGTRLIAGGEAVEDGGIATVAEAEARALIERGLAVPAEEGAPGDADGREERIAAAIEAMLAEDPDKTRDAWWTRSGKPEVREIEARCGLDLTAKERDRAWKAAGG